MQWLRRVLVCALVLLVIGETSGVARAFAPGATVPCCCGAHSAARPCPCPDCPVSLHRPPRDDHGQRAQVRLAAGRDCEGAAADEPGLLTVVALAALEPTSVWAPRAVRRLGYAAPLPLHGRAVDVGRPPP